MTNELIRNFVVLTFLTFSAAVQSDEQWLTVSDPADLRKLVTDRALEGKYWVYYFRADGKMAFLNRDYDSLVFREWSIADDGKLCSAVYGRPQNVVECFVLERTGGDPVQYRVRDEEWAPAAFDSPIRRRDLSMR